ncbi:CheR family methyltransferase [Gracilinema caldarium]|uniref:CheR family methyltransferase n=1 Tax=Gracilinema caldarium TaxID=215591 RepID=UPI0026EE34FB|nr:CheR family methyltransferase [Gracilinema caldarium]
MQAHEQNLKAEDIIAVGNSAAGSSAAGGNGETLRTDKAITVDFKMVTFSLAGKDYGVDIMNVKEIAKASKFTYVPNAAPFLRGVYNLRGEIIPVIDFRIFFHLPAERKSDDAMENLLILRLEDHVYGVIVDSIDKVVGIQSSNIQPPHPIFGDINIKYIHGVVENQGRLYIILDVNRIFEQKEEEKPRLISETASGTYFATQSAVLEKESAAAISKNSGSELEFIKETLFALKHFAATPLNETWIVNRFEEWKKVKNNKELQLKNVEDADEFLSTFYSPCNGRLWDETYAEQVLAALPDLNSKTIMVWNPGCGKGYESYSLACLLKKRYKDARIKIWASDNDLLAVSSAPNMVFELETVPALYQEYLVKGRYGYSFNQEIKDAILFEYHDMKNVNPFTDLDLIMARDVLSFQDINEQNKILNDFTEKLKARGLVLVGQHEQLPEEEWTRLGTDPVSLYMYNS